MIMKNSILSIILIVSTANVYGIRRTEVVSTQSTIKSWNCSFVDNICKCPESCMIPEKTENYCVLQNCYKYDENLGECSEDGFNHLTPVILQAIPFTGVFGSGYGNIGRWDIFGLYMGISLGGCTFILCSFCGCLFCCPQDKDGETKETALLCWSRCGYCVWLMVLLGFYISGIIQMATPGSVLDENGCPLVF